MKRLIKKQKQLCKTAGMVGTNFDYFVLQSGDVIGVGCRVVNNKPWYQVYQEGAYCTSSFYDGDNYETAIRMYKDLLTAFQGISYSEKFDKSETKIKQQVDQMIEEKKDDNYNFQRLKSDPLFLGVNPF